MANAPQVIHPSPTETYADRVASLEASVTRDRDSLRAWLARLVARPAGAAPEPAPTNTLIEGLHAALTARDHVAAGVANGAALSLGDLTTLRRADDELVRLTSKVVPLLQHLLPIWRQSALPAADRWWWRLDEAAAQRAESANLTLIAGLLITLALGLLTTIAARFWSGSTDATSIVTNGLLAAIAGGALTSFGRTVTDAVLLGVGVPRHWLSRAKLVVALAVVFGAVGFWKSLPRISASYTKAGSEHRANKRHTEALADLERAVALDPDSAEAHYQLGGAHADLHNYDKARTGLARAIELDANHVRATLDLARIGILTKDYSHALHELNTAFGKLPKLKKGEKNELHYLYNKSVAWYRLRLAAEYAADDDKRPTLLDGAHDAATQAIHHGDRADAYALRAEVMYRLGGFDDSNEDWKRSCERIVARGDDIEDEFRLSLLMRHLEGAEVCPEECEALLFGGE
jgi:tetratricopeptide (TPR) repeat protein